MEIKRSKISELMTTYCRGNYTRFARELKVDPAHLHRFMKTGVGGGKKIISGIMRFCKERDLDPQEYFDL